MTETPIALLKREHVIIASLIDGLRGVRNALERGETVPPKVLYQVVAFMHEFADRRHHAKEEDTLFPAMVRAGVPERGGPIPVMLAEHDQGRAAVAALERATDAYVEHGPAEYDAIISAIATITTLYTDHIFKEDNILYPMAESALGADDMAELSTAFARIEDEFSDDAHARLVEFARQLDRETAGE
jgi:hemerythrin-like domain-containing protein